MEDPFKVVFENWTSVRLNVCFFDYTQIEQFIIDLSLVVQAPVFWPSTCMCLIMLFLLK